ncbi:hypothetical protein DMN50_18610 [Priestia megaterium]|nr:hypothetical protein DMN50_18610 [Priestia megaterium]
MSLNFSKEQRALLINQFEILKHLDPSSTEEYDNKIEILYNGYSYFYEGIVGDVNEDLSEAVSRKVFDILDLYRDLYSSYENLTEEEQEQIEERHVIFRGFDGNEEIPYYKFAQFAVTKEGLYGEIKELVQEGKVEMNSHANRLRYYNDLLSRWKPLREELNGEKLNLEQIKHVLNK